MKTFAHTRWGDQMLELQRDFGALLRQTAIFKGITKLILLTDSHQKLRLRKQWLNLHAVLFGSRGQRREIYVRGDVLLSRGLVRICSCRVLAECHQRAAMPSRKLLLPRVAVVDDDENSVFQCCRHLRHVALRPQGDLNSFSVFGMNTVA